MHCSHRIRMVQNVEPRNIPVADEPGMADEQRQLPPHAPVRVLFSPFSNNFTNPNVAGVLLYIYCVYIYTLYIYIYIQKSTKML